MSAADNKKREFETTININTASKEVCSALMGPDYREILDNPWESEPDLSHIQG